MPDFVIVHNLVEANGKTVRENNLATEHSIPIGTLVEVNCDYLPEHRTRQFIAAHGRDCDGEPLYSLCASRNHCNDQIGTDGYGDARSQESIDLYRRVYHNGSWGRDALIIVDDPWNRDMEQADQTAELLLTDGVVVTPAKFLKGKWMAPGYNGVNVEFHPTGWMKMPPS
jgi:hypothetical protein